MVPDFLSRPWDGTCDEVPAAIHVLAACTSRRLRKTAAPMQVLSVVVLPSWQGSLALQTKHQRTGLWSVTTGTSETSRDAASRAVRSLEQDLGVPPTLICVWPILKACHCGEQSLVVITCHIPSILRVSGCLTGLTPTQALVSATF